MKKIVLLLMATFTFAFYTKANNFPKCPDLKFEAKAQFVKWTNVPSHKKVEPIWVKNALQGKNFEDAVVNSYASVAYKKVLGEDMYNKILSGDDSRFKMGLSRGGEINWGISSGGQPTKMQLPLAAGVWVIYFDDQPVIKWGTNGCLNALTAPPAFVDDGEDPDGQKEEVVKNPIKEGSLKLAGGNSQVMYNMTAAQVQSDNEKLLLGMAIRENHMLVDFAVAKDLINSKQCCNDNNGGMIQMSTPAPSMYVMAAPQPAAQMASYPTGGNLNVTVRNKANGWDIANTLLNGANTFFNGVNTYRGVRLEGNRNQNYYSNNWNGGGNPTVRGPFQGSGALGYTLSGNNNSGGGLIYSGGTTGGGIGTTGGWNNGW